MAVHQAQPSSLEPPAPSKTESTMMNMTGPSTHNQVEMTATNFGQGDCPDSQMNGQEPYEQDSLELSASPTPYPNSCEMPSQ